MPKQSKWEDIDKKLKKFAKHILYQDARGHEVDPGVLRSFKQFISDLLSKQRKELFEKLDKASYEMIEPTERFVRISVIKDLLK